METYWQQAPYIVGDTEPEQFLINRQDKVRRVFESFIIEKSDVQTHLIDIGCNTGIEGYRLCLAGFPGRYLGIDSNEKALVLAGKNLACFTRASVKFADATCIPEADRTFDFVLSKDVIEHAIHYRGILREMCRLARRWVILCMFIRPSDRPDQIVLDQPNLYLNRYNRQEMYKFVEILGFKPPNVIYRDSDEEIIVFERINEQNPG
jgi:ubiquinone/menaquinone biosynthesis C-methylase UbiE